MPLFPTTTPDKPVPVLTDRILLSSTSEGGIASDASLQEILDALFIPVDSEVVHSTGAETVDGVKTFSSSPIVPTPSSGTQAVNKSYVDAIVAGLLDYRGAYNASVNTFPASGGSGTAGAVLKGDMWIISVAGTLGGTAVQIGDSVIASIDTPGQTAGNWNILNSNIAYVPEDVANKATTMTGNTASNTLYLTAKAIYDWVTTLLLASLAGKTTPVNADGVPIMDSAASNVMKFLSFTNMKAFLKTYFDTIYAQLAGSISQAFSALSIDFGHATDTTMARSRAGHVSVEGTDLGFLEIPQNSQSVAYTFVLEDSGKSILHPSSDTTPRVWTIPANASVAFPVGTAITIVNDTSAGTLTIAITTDTLVLAGAGTTGSRTLTANGIATIYKKTSTSWIISGVNLT